MSAFAHLHRLPAFGLGAFLAAAPLWWGLPARAEGYGRVPPDPRASETAARFDPFDPVPEIGFGGCHDRDCHRFSEHRHRPPPPPPPRPIDVGNAVMVDCSGRHPEMFATVNAALEHAPPNSSVLILPPDKGGTCVETVHTHWPVVIGTFGGGTAAVIQAPRGKPCLIADLALGDTLTIDAIRFIARGRDEPCVSVQAGRVVVRSSTIDSRSSAWAFDVAESGELSVEDTYVETDGSGVRARRARVDLHNLDIDIDEGRSGVGLSLDRVDGVVDGGALIGGEVGILASSGTHGLRLNDIKIHKAGTGVQLQPGGLGAVALNHLTITGGERGIAVAPETEADVTDNIVGEARFAGIEIAPHARTRVTGNTIYAPRGARCIVGPSGDNICHKEWSWWPF